MWKTLSQMGWMTGKEERSICQERMKQDGIEQSINLWKEDISDDLNYNEYET